MHSFAPLQSQQFSKLSFNTWWFFNANLAKGGISHQILRFSNRCWWHLLIKIHFTKFRESSIASACNFLHSSLLYIGKIWYFRSIVYFNREWYFGDTPHFYSVRTPDVLRPHRWRSSSRATGRAPRRPWPSPWSLDFYVNFLLKSRSFSAVSAPIFASK